LVSLVSSAFAQTDLIKKANDLYSKGDYSAASELYEQVLKTDQVAPELYYNLANSYYKMNETGRSILNYERALRIKPNYKAARVNLEMAQQKVVDNVVQVPSFFLMRWMDYLMKLLSSNEWFVISLISLVVTIAGFMFFIFGYTLSFRKTSFYIAVVFLAFTVVGMFFSGLRKSQLMHQNEAVIMVGSVSVKSSPDKSGTDLFQPVSYTHLTLPTN
jgi:tetratricopeptide (TPR) repeat protein